MKEGDDTSKQSEKGATEDSWLKRRWLRILVVAVSVATVGILALMIVQLAQQVSDKTKQVSQLETKVSQLEKKVGDMATKPAEKTPEADAPAKTCTTLNGTQRDNVIASITSGNTAALEGYLTNPNKVILAASEGIGQRTPDQAVADITSFISGSSGWNFLLADIETEAFAAGSYSQYFPDDAIIGKASNGRVISFLPDCDGKIKTVFLSMDASLLRP